MIPQDALIEFANAENSPWHVRWRFEYSDGKPSKYGMWDNGDQSTPWGSASKQSKENLMFAMVEVENRDRNKCLHAVVCSGPDFCNFEWQGTSFVVTTVNKNGARSSEATETRIDALVLVTRTQRFKVYRSGVIEVEERTDSDSMFHYGAEGLA